MSKGNKTNEKAAVIMNKALTFLKHNIYYIIMGVCVLALATVITVAAVINSNKAKAQIPNDNEDILSPAPDNTDHAADSSQSPPRPLPRTSRTRIRTPATAWR